MTEKTNKNIVLSGIKPTGRPHIGNYFGMMRQVVDSASDKNHQTFAMVADYHALTSTQDATKLQADILDIVIDYLALGLNLEQATLFQQSAVPAHTELGWIFNCITTMPYLARAHAYKDATAKGEEVSVGTFDYPLLMAADILLYDTDLVPVGRDQKQHVEYARDTAEKFNRLFGQTFKLPEPQILAEVETVPGNDGRKMSKSYGNHLPLFASDEEIKKFVLGIKTDSKGVAEAKDPASDIVFSLHKLVSAKDLSTLSERYRAGGIGYKESKDILIANLIALIAPLRIRREMVASDHQKVLAVLADGAEKARDKSTPKMNEIRQKVGVDLSCF